MSQVEESAKIFAAVFGALLKEIDGVEQVDVDDETICWTTKYHGDFALEISVFPKGELFNHDDDPTPPRPYPFPENEDDDD